MATKRRTGAQAHRRTDVRVTARVRVPVAVAAVRRLAEAVLKAEKARVSALSITFVGPARMRTINREHLGHDWVTDVIAFGLKAAIGNRQSAVGQVAQSGRKSLLPIARSLLPVVGDIYICPSVAAANARLNHTTATDELRRLVIHGILHVLGYDHAEGAERELGAMWRRQERYLARFGGKAP